MLHMTPFKNTQANKAIKASGSSLTDAIARGELFLSLSSLLGCDYIFVRHKGMHELLQPRFANKTVYEILSLLDTAPRQSMVVGADQLDNGSFAFTRYEYTWERRQVRKVSIIPVTDSEQIEFMQMMLSCSSDY